MWLTGIWAGSRIETYEYEKSWYAPDKRTRTLRTPNRKNVERRRDNAKRAGDNFRRLICANLDGTDPPALVSATFYTFVDFPTAYSHLRKFIARLNRVGFQGLRYISVAEFQRRGTIHFHILIWGLPDSVLLHEGSRGKGYKSKVRWGNWLVSRGYSPADFRTTRNLQAQWQQGYLDITPTDGDGRISTYMAKYLSKAVHDKRFSGEKVFSCSRNVLRPVFLKGDAATIALEETIDVDNHPLQIREYETEWRGRAIYKRYSR